MTPFNKLFLATTAMFITPSMAFAALTATSSTMPTMSSSVPTATSSSMPTMSSSIPTATSSTMPTMSSSVPTVTSSMPTDPTNTSSTTTSSSDDCSQYAISMMMEKPDTAEKFADNVMKYAVPNVYAAAKKFNCDGYAVGGACIDPPQPTVWPIKDNKNGALPNPQVCTKFQCYVRGGIAPNVITTPKPIGVVNVPSGNGGTANPNCAPAICNIALCN